MLSEDRKYDPSLWPTERKPKPKEGKLDELGFFHTPNGSFYDFDDEYFNKNGYDIHGGFYTKDKEYIMGPNWIDELGCYEDEKEKYLNSKNIDEFEDDEEDIPMEDDFAEEGDFAYDDKEGEFDYETAIKEAEAYKAMLNLNINNTNTTNTTNVTNTTNTTKPKEEKKTTHSRKRKAKKK